MRPKESKSYSKSIFVSEYNYSAFYKRTMIYFQLSLSLSKRFPDITDAYKPNTFYSNSACPYPCYLISTYKRYTLPIPHK